MQIQQLRQELQIEVDNGEELRRRLETMKADLTTKQSQNQHLITTVSNVNAELEEMRRRGLWFFWKLFINKLPHLDTCCR